MFRICDLITPRFVTKGVSRVKLLPSIVSAAVILSSSSLAGAATLDWNVASGDWDLNTNWRNFAGAGSTPASPPGSADTANVRNGGTVTLSNNRSSQGVFIGNARIVSSVDVGLDGAMDWTGGTLNTNNFRVGVEHNGVVTQNGATTSISFTSAGNFKLGDVGPLQSGTGTYTLQSGAINLTSGTTGNHGIDLINGTFNMKGGTISQPTIGNIQRAFRIASRDDATGTLNISGGTITAEGGFRVANNVGSTGNVNINEADGTTSVTLGGDVAIGRNMFGQGNMVMDAGTLTIGKDGGPTARMQAGDEGPGKITINGGTINIFDALRLAKGMPAAGFVDNSSSILLKGGTINARAFESRTDNPTGLETITSTFTIDGGTFNQVSALGQTTTIGQRGKVKLEILSGVANVMGLELGATVDSQAIVELKGGTLAINGNGSRLVNRTVFSGTPLFLPSVVPPTVSLTGGNLILTSTTGSTTVWQTDFNNQGTNVTLKPADLLTLHIGDASRSGDFSMSSGSLNIDIGGHHESQIDRFNLRFPGATGSLTGGTINLNYINGYTPIPGDSMLLITAPATGSVTVNPAAVTINSLGNYGGAWAVQKEGNNIRLVYNLIPEPASCVLAAMGLMVGMSGFRRRS